MRTREVDYLVVGGGLAAASAVDGIRQEDEEGTIVLLSEEEEPPYHRPPLSKEFLQHPGVARSLLHVKPEGWFEEEAGVELLLGTRAIALDPEEMVVRTDDANAIHARKILLATGGRARRLPAPGHHLAGVETLRTVEDAERIRQMADEAERAVLVGAGFIGMELAASLHAHDVSSTVVELEDRVWSRMLPPQLSGFMQSYFEERGVTFALGESPSEFRGEDSRVEAVALESGAELDCDLVVVGIGIRPAVELARDAGLEVGDGIVVDRFGETSGADVYAAGDVAAFPDPIFGDVLRVEHWDHAKAHGRAVGRCMAGVPEPYDHLSYFFSDVFDLSLNVYGRPVPSERVLLRGEPGEEPFIAFTVTDGRIQGAVLVNVPDEMDACHDLVRNRPEAEALEDALTDPETELAGLAEETPSA